MQSDQRIRELDGLRGVAVLMVLAWHFIGCMTNPTLGGVNFAIHAATIFGRTGVDLFFVLSGFLIIGILIDNRESGNLFSVFYTRRIARIFPAYFLLIAIYWTCVVAIGPSPAFNAAHGVLAHLGAQIGFAYNLLMAIDNGPVSRGFAVTWSIGIEEQFYLVAPLCIWLTPKRHLLKLLIGAAVFAIISRAGIYAAFPAHDLAPYVLPFTRLDCLCAGGILAIVWRDQSVFLKIQKVAPTAMSVLSLLVLFMVYKNVTGDLSANMYYWGHTVLSAFYFFVVLSVIAWRPALLRIPFLRATGTISYGLYLFHPLFISLFFQVAGRPERVESLTDALLAADALIAAVLFCVASYALIERPIRRLGHVVVYDKSLPTGRVGAPTQA